MPRARACATAAALLASLLALLAPRALSTAASAITTVPMTMMVPPRPGGGGGGGGRTVEPVRVTVMGGGNFGLALASVVAKRGATTTLLVRSEDVAAHVNSVHRHPRYMSDISLPRTVRATTNAASALGDATYVIHAVPVLELLAVAQQGHAVQVGEHMYAAWVQGQRHLQQASEFEERGEG